VEAAGVEPASDEAQKSLSYERSQSFIFSPDTTPIGRVLIRYNLLVSSLYPQVRTREVLRFFGVLDALP